MSIQVSVHHNCRWAGAERFHIRVTVPDAMVVHFVEKVAYYAESDTHEYFDVGGWFKHGGKKFKLEEGEFGGPVINPKPSDIAFVSICVDTIQFDMTPFQGGWNIDFSIQKEYGDDRDLDYMRYLDTGIEEELPECFWIEPASIVRTMLKA